jgi:hypothetical protein
MPTFYHVRFLDPFRPGDPPLHEWSLDARGTRIDQGLLRLAALHLTCYLEAKPATTTVLAVVTHGRSEIPKDGDEKIGVVCPAGTPESPRAFTVCLVRHPAETYRVDPRSPEMASARKAFREQRSLVETEIDSKPLIEAHNVPQQ